MLAMQGGEEVKTIKGLKPGEKRIFLLLKPTGFEYRFEGKWTGKDVRNTVKFIMRAYRMYKRKKAKPSLSKEK